MEKVESSLSYIVNMDYEFNLYENTSNFKGKSLSEFEYIFFFIENKKKKLFSNISYDHIYLSHLENYGIKIPEIISKTNKKPLNWWGRLDQKTITLEKTLNSKKYSLKIAKELGLCPNEISNIQNNQELDAYIESSSHLGDFILKEEYGFSGIGHKVISQKYQSIKISGTKTISPLYERVLDLGISFDMENQSYFIVQNFIGKDFKFTGGLFVGDVYRLGALYDFVNEEELLEKISIMLAYFKKIGVKSNIAVDMFYYKKDHQIRPYYMVEINYRKTMGLMIKALNTYSTYSYTAWVIIPKKKILDNVKDFINMINKNKVAHTFITSPETSFFRSIAFNATTPEELGESISRFSRNCLSANDKFLGQILDQLKAR